MPTNQKKKGQRGKLQLWIVYILWLTTKLERDYWYPVMFPVYRVKIHNLLSSARHYPVHVHFASVQEWKISNLYKSWKMMLLSFLFAHIIVACRPQFEKFSLICGQKIRNDVQLIIRKIISRSTHILIIWINFGDAFLKSKCWH